MRYFYTLVFIFLNWTISWGGVSLPQDLEMRCGVLKSQLDRIEKADSLLFVELPKSFGEYYGLYGSEDKPLYGYPNILEYLMGSESARDVTQNIIGIATSAVPGKYYDSYLQDLLLSKLYKGWPQKMVSYLNRHSYTENVVFWQFLFLRKEGLCPIAEMERANAWLKKYNAFLRLEEYKYLDAIKEGYYRNPSASDVSFHIDQRKVSRIKALFNEVEDADCLLLAYLPTSFDEYFALCGFDQDTKGGALYFNQDIISRLARSRSIDREELVRKVVLLCSGGKMPDTDHIGILQDFGYAFVSGKMAHYSIPALNRMSYDENLSFWRFIFGGIEARIPECEMQQVFYNFEYISQEGVEKYQFMETIRTGYYNSVDGLYH